MFKQKLYADLIVSSHNVSRGTSLFPMFSEIKNFLEKNPKEFLIVKIKGEGENLEGFCNNIIANHIVALFKDQMITQKDSDSWFNIEDLTMEDLHCRKKNILFLVSDSFFEKYLIELGKDFIENSEMARETLMKIGIFPVAKFLRDEKFKSDDVRDLLLEMDKSFQRVTRKVMRVNHYTLTALKKLQIKYLWKPPTIDGMEKNEFAKNNIAMGHLIESINKGRDINLGNISKNTFFNFKFCLIE